MTAGNHCTDWPACCAAVALRSKQAATRARYSADEQTAERGRQKTPVLDT